MISRTSSKTLLMGVYKSWLSFTNTKVPFIPACRSRCLTNFQSVMNSQEHIAIPNMILITDPALRTLPQVTTTCAPRRETLASSRDITSRLDGAGTAVPVEEVTDPGAGRTAVVPPHGRDVGALCVAWRVKAEALGLVAVRGIVGDPGEPVPPCRRRALELGAAGVAVEVDLCALAGLPLGRGGLCQVGDGHGEREEVRGYRVVGYLLRCEIKLVTV